MTGYYRDDRALRSQIRSVLNFYYPACIDTHLGGYVGQLDERRGHVYDGATKHIVATTRFIHNFAVGAMLDGPDWCRPAAEHGLAFLESGHWDPDHGGYDWILDGRETSDATRYCYGHAFVMLAGARAHQAGLPDARRHIERAADSIDEHFWEPEHGLCATEATPDWSTLDSYRGQNANMHTCEAMLAAYEATGEDRFLERSLTIADSLTRDVAAATDGRLWEHFDPDWSPDREYNRDDPDHQFRPWGYQAGHHVEWTKLLLLLYEQTGEAWLPDRAEELFETAIDLGWDDEHGGFYYTAEADGTPVNPDKYSWPVTEAIGAAALLADVVDSSYGEWYDRLWRYGEEHFVNPNYGNWYERLIRGHERDGPNHGPVVEPGYHPINNAWVAMGVFGSGGT